jgi:hypothetical protein
MMHEEDWGESLVLNCSGRIRQLGAALLGTGIAFCIGTATPALADCLQDGTTVNCSGASPSGFTAAQDGLAVTVQPGATVGNGTTNNITVNENSSVTNFGLISVASTGIHGETGTTVINNGWIVAGPQSVGIRLGGSGGSIVNNGTIIVGDGSIPFNGGIVAFGDRFNNSGTVMGGNGVSGVAFTFTVNDATLSNSGTIITGNNSIALLGAGRPSHDGDQYRNNHGWTECSRNCWRGQRQHHHQ